MNAAHLLELSGRARWAFPSSMGNPLAPGHEAEEWVEELVAERDSLLDAARGLDDEAALEVAARVWRVWMVPRDLTGGRAFLAAVLDRGAETQSRDRALALYGDGLMAFWQGAHEESRGRNEAALAAARAVDDPEALALACLGLSRVALADGDHERARSLAVEAREHARPLAPALGQAPLHLHAQATRLAGDYDEAAALFEESLALNRQIGDPGMVAVELHNLGHVELHRGNVDAAEGYFDELGPAGDPYGAAMTRLNEAALAVARGHIDRARLLLDGIEIELATDDQFELDWLRARLS
jgi:tetratricopeptide (TPR) repeat protein